MTKVILDTPNHSLYNTLHSLGFGEITNSGFPGERSGELLDRPVWAPFILATLSFGYGVSVTTLQLAQAYATLANNGIKIPVTFLKSNEPPQGTQVLNPKVTHELLTMLESVLYDKGGTAPAARIPGYYVTGKTGTARILGPHGYEKDHHNGMFVGIAPASNPQLVVAIMIHDPQGAKYFGGDVAAPVFSRIMSQALRLLNVPPDNLNQTTNNSATPSNNAPRNLDA
jgi:cell division protein FtsI (penicillin-binding protein 3)